MLLDQEPEVLGQGLERLYLRVHPYLQAVSGLLDRGYGRALTYGQLRRVLDRHFPVLDPDHVGYVRERDPGQLDHDSVGPDVEPLFALRLGFQEGLFDYRSFQQAGGLRRQGLRTALVAGAAGGFAGTWNWLMEYAGTGSAGSEPGWFSVVGPQHLTRWPVVIPQLMKLDTLTDENSVPWSSVGMAVSSLWPQHVTTLVSARIAHVWYLPADTVEKAIAARSEGTSAWPKSAFGSVLPTVGWTVPSESTSFSPPQQTTSPAVWPFWSSCTPQVW